MHQHPSHTKVQFLKNHRDNFFHLRFDFFHTNRAQCHYQMPEKNAHYLAQFWKTVCKNKRIVGSTCSKSVVQTVTHINENRISTPVENNFQNCYFFCGFWLFFHHTINWVGACFFHWSQLIWKKNSKVYLDLRQRVTNTMIQPIPSVWHDDLRSDMICLMIEWNVTSFKFEWHVIYWLCVTVTWNLWHQVDDKQLVVELNERNCSEMKYIKQKVLSGMLLSWNLKETNFIFVEFFHTSNEIIFYTLNKRNETK